MTFLEYRFDFAKCHLGVTPSDAAHSSECLDGPFEQFTAQIVAEHIRRLLKVGPRIHAGAGVGIKPRILSNCLDQ